MLTTCLLCCASLLAAPPDADRPNIVLIIADDQAYSDFGFMGSDAVQTPHLDRLAAQSARFPNGYVPMSVCRPSLATLLTGLYPHEHGVHFNHPPPGLAAMRKMSAADYRAARAHAESLIGNVPTLPRILAKHGYACLQTGKHWEGDYQNVGFTHGMTTGLPADSDKYGTRQQENGEYVAHGNGDAGLAIGRDTMQPIYDFIDEQAGRRPFFIWFAPFLPHTPFDASEKHQKRFADRADIPTHLRRYHAEIARFDDTVGELVDYVDRKGLLQNTLFVFVVDNGYRPTERNTTPATISPRAHVRSKWSPYENGIRTPILIRWPARIEPREYSQIVQSVDLVPTIFAAAGLETEITPRMSGINLLPAARGATKLPERAAFGAVFPNDATTLNDPQRDLLARWIRRGNYKLIVPQPNVADPPLSLFDLAADPQEMNNLANDPRFTTLVNELREELDNWWMPTN